MVKIRLRRMGKKKQPTYRIVVADEQSPRNGRFIESIGYHNPRVQDNGTMVKRDRLDEWVGKGAQATDAVRRILVNVGMWKAEPFTKKTKAAKKAKAE